MIVRYTELPGGASPRPLLPVAVNGVEVKALVDSGAVNSVFGRWVAEDAGLDLDAADERNLGLGGSGVTGQFVTVTLEAAEVAWEAEVGFADVEGLNWGLLGHGAFFRFFTVSFRAVDHEFEVTPISE